MNSKITISICIVLLTSGCAKYSKQQKSDALSAVQSSQRTVNTQQRRLENSGAYFNGQCSRPSRGSKPKPYVRNEQDAKDIASAFCLSSVGCDAYVSMSGANTAWKRFAASETCGRALDQLRADGLVANNTGINAVESALAAGCDSKAEGIWGLITKGVACSMDFSAKIVKVAQLDSCLRNKHKQFLNQSENWYYGPSKKLDVCVNTLKKLQVAEDRLARDRANYNMMINY